MEERARFTSSVAFGKLPGDADMQSVGPSRRGGIGEGSASWQLRYSSGTAFTRASRATPRSAYELDDLSTARKSPGVRNRTPW